MNGVDVDSDGDPLPPPLLAVHAQHAPRQRGGKALQLMGGSPPPSPVETATPTRTARSTVPMSFGKGQHRAAMAKKLKKVVGSYGKGEHRALATKKMKELKGSYGKGEHRKAVRETIIKVVHGKHKGSGPIFMMLSLSVVLIQHFVRRWLHQREIRRVRAYRAPVQRTVSDLGGAAHVRRQSIALAVQHHSEEQHRRLLAKRAKLRMKRDAQLAAEGQRPIAEEVEADSGDPPPPSSAPPLDGNDDDDANDPPPPSSAPPPPTDEAAVDPPPPAVETTTDEEEDITELTPLESADEDEEEEEEEEEDEEETEANAEAHAEAKGEAKTTAEGSDEWVSPRTRTVQAQVSDILSSLQDDHAAQQALMQASRDRLARRRAKIHAHREHVAAVVQHFDALDIDGDGHVSLEDLQTSDATKRLSQRLSATMNAEEAEELTKKLFEEHDDGGFINRGTLVELLDDANTAIEEHDEKVQQHDAETGSYSAVATANVLATAIARIAELPANTNATQQLQPRALLTAGVPTAAATAAASASAARASADALSRIAELEAELERTSSSFAKELADATEASAQLTMERDWAMKSLAHAEENLATAEASVASQEAALTDATKEIASMNVAVTKAKRAAGKAQAQVKAMRGAGAAGAAHPHGAAAKIQAAARRKIVKKKAVKKKKTAGLQSEEGEGDSGGGGTTTTSEGTPRKTKKKVLVKKKKKILKKSTRTTTPGKKKKKTAVRKKKKKTQVSHGDDDAEEEEGAAASAEAAEYAEWKRSKRATELTNMATPNKHHIAAQAKAIVAFGILKENHRALRARHEKLVARHASVASERDEHKQAKEKAEAVHELHSELSDAWFAERDVLQEQCAHLRAELTDERTKGGADGLRLQVRAAELGIRETQLELHETQTSLHETETNLHEVESALHLSTVAEASGKAELEAARSEFAATKHETERLLLALQESKGESAASHAATLAEQAATLATRELEIANEQAAAHARALEALQSAHARELRELQATHESTQGEHSSTMQALKSSVQMWQKSYQTTQVQKRERALEEANVAATLTIEVAQEAHAREVRALMEAGSAAEAAHGAAIAALSARHDAEVDVLRVATLGVLDAAAIEALHQDRARLHTSLGASERRCAALKGELRSAAVVSTAQTAATQATHAHEIADLVAARRHAVVLAEAKRDEMLAVKLRENSAWERKQRDPRTVLEQRQLLATLAASRERVARLRSELHA